MAKKRKNKEPSEEVVQQSAEVVSDIDTVVEDNIRSSIQFETSLSEEVSFAGEENENTSISEEQGLGELEAYGDTPLFTEPEPESFLPEVTELQDQELDASENDGVLASTESVEGTELDSFESAEIEEVEFIEEERLDSILESILFASDRPVSLASLKLVFKGTNVRTDKLRRAIDRLAVELAGSRRGVTLEEVTGGFQLRTKYDNLEFMKRTLKSRPFKLSGPALEVLSIVAYKQPTIKHEVDEIRGVESGHLLRALMEKNLITFEGRAEDKPGKPMQYGTTRKFLEIFGLRNLKELPTLSQIDELLPEGMTEEDEKEKLKLSDLTEPLSQSIGASYSDSEEELQKVASQLDEINTSSEFFEQEKKRQQEKRDADRAQNIRDAIMMGEEVSNRDKNWLARYDEALMMGTAAQFSASENAETNQHIENQEQIAEADLEKTLQGIEESEGGHHEESLFDDSHEANDLADIEA